MQILNHKKVGGGGGEKMLFVLFCFALFYGP